MTLTPRSRALLWGAAAVAVVFAVGACLPVWDARYQLFYWGNPDAAGPLWDVPAALQRDAYWADFIADQTGVWARMRLLWSWHWWNLRLLLALAALSILAGYAAFRWRMRRAEARTTEPGR